MTSEADWTRIIEGWRTRRGLSEHTRLEIAASRPGDPLAPGAPVPGCACPNCTGVEADDPDPGRSEATKPSRPPLPVEKARAASIVTVARRLGLDTTDDGYGEPRATCPFHDDQNPSLRLNPAKGVWYCFPCGEGGDAIELAMRVRSVRFPVAVKWIARGTTR